MKLLASALLLGLVLASHGGDAQIRETLPGLPYYCPDKPDVHYYADVITGCRVFHLCSGPEPLHFICPPGLIFNEKAHVCDFPSNVECKTSSHVLRLLGLRGEKIPLRDAFIQNIQAHVSIPPKLKSSSAYLRDLPDNLKIAVSDLQSEPSSFSLTKFSVDYSTHEPTEPSYVDEDLIEMLIKRTEELENGGQLVSSDVDNYVLPPASPREFQGDNYEDMGPSEEILHHIISQQISESEKVKPTMFPENVGLFKDIVKPALSIIISNRTTLIKIRKALLSALTELKPIALELLHMGVDRTKRSVEEQDTVSAKPEIKLQDGVPSKLAGSESEITAIETETIQNFDEINECFQQFWEIMSTDKAFRLAVTKELARIIETEGLLDALEDLLQLPSHQMRRKRFVSSPIVIPREIVEKVKAGLTAHTKPIVKDVLAATLPTFLRVASNNVPLILNIVDSLKPLLKDRFPTMLKHTAALVTKYDNYKRHNPGHITVPTITELIADFMPYVLAGVDVGGEYMRQNPRATFELLFGSSGLMSQIFSNNYRSPVQ